ncbi:MAG: DUF429 domain-containing protein [bacterium]
MAWIAGVDGCHKGWFIVSYETKEKTFKHECVDKSEEVMQLGLDYKVIAVDMPIGLLDHAKHGGRTCDTEARELLKPPKAASVFPPPVRQVLVMMKQTGGKLTYEEALKINRASSPENIGISIMAYSLLPKLKEIDDFMNPQSQKIIKEIHPELCFYEMNKDENNNCKSAAYSKKKPEGIKEREDLLLSQQSLIPCLSIENISKMYKGYKRKDVKKDDILDACAALWTAQRILNRKEDNGGHGGKAIRIPSNPVPDSHGLFMEMWR